MTEEDYFAHFAAALFAAYRTDPHKTDVIRDVERSFSEAKVAAGAAFSLMREEARSHSAKHSARRS